MSKLRDAVLNGSVEASIVAQHLREGEFWLGDLENSAQVASLCESLSEAVERGDSDVIDRMQSAPDRVALVFALTPSSQMFRMFDAIERVDETLLPRAVQAAQGPIAAIAQSRFDWLQALSTLCRVLSRRVPIPTPGG